MFEKKANIFHSTVMEKDGVDAKNDTLFHLVSEFYFQSCTHKYFFILIIPQLAMYNVK